MAAVGTALHVRRRSPAPSPAAEARLPNARDRGTDSLLDALLAAGSPEAEERAWQAFVVEHTRLLMAVARTLGGEHDRVMDRFAYVLEQLRRDGYRRLRAFVPDGSAKFTTWLVVASRRLCVDHERRRYGRRNRDTTAAAGEDRQLRRRLADAESHGGEIDTLVDPDAAPPDAPLLDDERAACLARAVADLPPADQLLLRLRFEEDLTAAEISRLMHFPTQFHVYRRLKALLPQLRERLRDAGIEGPDL